MLSIEFRSHAVCQGSTGGPMLIFSSCQRGYILNDFVLGLLHLHLLQQELLE